VKPHWQNLNDRERSAFRTVVAFLDGRLEDRATIEWALRLKPQDAMRRLAVLELINSPHSKDIKEPWRSAWRLIEECWNEEPRQEHGTEVYQLQRRLQSGDRSGSLITEIVKLVEPRLEVRELSAFRLYGETPPSRPRRVEDLLYASLAGGDVGDLDVLKLNEVGERQFLQSLAVSLDSAVSKGLDLARRLGWDGETSLWRLGSLSRVYFVPASERGENSNEPDLFHHGIAPSVKLLYATTCQLAKADISAAKELLQRWKHTVSPIHVRLWAAMARNPAMADADEIVSFFGSLDDRCFWDVGEFPEVSEVRAVRFKDMAAPDQLRIVNRIQRLPPRRLWFRRGTDPQKVKQARIQSALRELRRIELGGGELPKNANAWLSAALPQYADVSGMNRLDDGAREAAVARRVRPNPDSQYDDLSGEARLKALESGLSAARLYWLDNEEKRAADWIQVAGNAEKLLNDLLLETDGGGAFPRVWEHFGWSHKPPADSEPTTEDESLRQAAEGLTVLGRLPRETIRLAIDGISHWLSTWEKWVARLPNGKDVWLIVWPIAVDATNAQQEVDEKPDLNTQVRSSSDQEPQDLDTLNTPVGRLLGVFFAACPNLNQVTDPFGTSAALRVMRDRIMNTTERSSLIARHRMIESLPYFLNADRDWATEYLIKPLLADDGEAITLWRAAARRIQFNPVLKIIGGAMSERAIDMRLGRESRRFFVLSLVVEALHAFHEQREPAVSFVRIQQMLRSLDDEVRAYGADAVQRFVNDMSSPEPRGRIVESPEQLFRSSALPFLRQVWPQDKSLTTPGVSKAFAALPAAARDAFAEAVDAVERFLVPFECWSLLDYGLFGDEGENKKLLIINDQRKAEALIKLFDLTIGTAEGAVIPYDLPDALDQVRSVAPGLAESKTFRRLATLARRG
jgi:hypothetical protein